MHVELLQTKVDLQFARKFEQLKHVAWLQL